MSEDRTTERQDLTTRATMLVDEFVTALVNSRIYQLDHPRLQDSLTRVLDHVRELGNFAGIDRIRIACTEGMVFFSGKPLVGASISAARLIALLDNWKAGGIELARHATREELAVFFACILESKRHPSENYTAVNSRATERQCIHVQLLPAVGSGAPEENAAPEEAKKPAAADGFKSLPGTSAAEQEQLRAGVQSYQNMMDMLQGVTVSVCRGGTIDFAPVLTQAEKILEHLETRGSALLGLARQDQYDAFTFGHSIRVAILATNFARELTANRELQLRIGAAALLHDVGKSLIPFEILHSSKRLTAEERREMGKHSELGAQCLLDHHDSDPLAITAAFGHHLSPDGTGYPNTIHEHPITWITSIVKICDIFEALTAARPYKAAMPPVRAYRIMLAMGDKLDRGLLKRFIEINGIYPIGQMVELAEGAVAVVKEQTDDPLHPIVQIVRDSDGDTPDPEENELFDLREVSCPNVRIILGEVLSLKEPEPEPEPEGSSL